MPCDACGNSEVSYGWVEADPNKGILDPPKDLVSSNLCFHCYDNLGAGLEDAIRKHKADPVVVNIIPRVIMPNGVDGLNCLHCGMFYAYVEQNCKNGYKCRECR